MSGPALGIVDRGSEPAPSGRSRGRLNFPADSRESWKTSSGKAAAPARAAVAVEHVLPAPARPRPHPSRCARSRIFCVRCRHRRRRVFRRPERPSAVRLAFRLPRDAVALINMTGGTSGQGQEVYGRTHHDIALQGHLHYLPWYMAGLRPGHLALNCVPQGGLTRRLGPARGLSRRRRRRHQRAGGLQHRRPRSTSRCASATSTSFIASTNFLHTLTDAMHRRGLSPARSFPGMRGILIAGEGYLCEVGRDDGRRVGLRLARGLWQHAGRGLWRLDVPAGTGRSPPRRAACMDLFEGGILEVINPPTLEPVRSGETGELVVTNLSIEGSPVIRFRTGNSARFISHQDTGSDRAWNAMEYSASVASTTC